MKFSIRTQLALFFIKTLIVGKFGKKYIKQNKIKIRSTLIFLLSHGLELKDYVSTKVGFVKKELNEIIEEAKKISTNRKILHN